MKRLRLRPGRGRRPMLARTSLLLVVVAALVVVVAAPSATADSLPTGERSFHQSTLEPFYNAEQAGQIGFLLTPNKAPMRANPAAWSPLYIVVYPTSTTVSATLNCMHMPVENCPSHGDEVAAAAAAINPAVYGSGVLGHDHIGDFPGGADFNFAWEPVLVLFTSATAANEHLVTDAQIAQAQADGKVIEVRAPDLTFNCAAVSGAVWNMATPIVG
jgi:hypothetical protein